MKRVQSQACHAERHGQFRSQTILLTLPWIANTTICMRSSTYCISIRGDSNCIIRFVWYFEYVNHIQNLFFASICLDPERHAAAGYPVYSRLCYWTVWEFPSTVQVSIWAIPRDARRLCVFVGVVFYDFAWTKLMAERERKSPVAFSIHFIHHNQSR